MKKFISIILVVITLISTMVLVTSCGEKAECEYCEELVSAKQLKQKEYDGDVYNVCRKCANLIQNYNDGKAIECDMCNDLVLKKDARGNDFTGEMCPECYKEFMEFFME